MQRTMQTAMQTAMHTARFSPVSHSGSRAGTRRLREEPASDAGSDPKFRRPGLQQTEPGLGLMLRRLDELALEETERGERALSNRGLELRQACDLLRRHLASRKALDPEAWTRKP